MKRREVNTEYIAAQVVINKDKQEDIESIEFNRGSILDKVRVVVNDAADAGSLQLKYAGVNLGSAIDLKTKAVTEVVGKGMAINYDLLEFEVTGTLTSGSVDVFAFMFLPSREKKSI